MGIHRLCTHEQDLLTGGENRLHRRMWKRSVVQQRQDHGHTGAVIRTQRGAVSFYEAVLHIDVDGLRLEVKRHIRILGAHHIQMRL